MNSTTAAEADDALATNWPDTERDFREENTQLEPRPKSSTPRGFSDHALPAGTQIEGFSVVRPIGEGGFGIVYLAWDAALERHVAIKEYMPKQLATRKGATLNVAMRSERDRGIFDEGLKSFVNEARLLARFNHPALVKVLRFWQANGTAYMAMPYYEGPTLKAALEHTRTRPNEATIRDWLRSLLDALSAIHRENCYHRDISPDNILLTDSGPLLLDFGAARHVITDRTQALTAVLKPGFAPIEQYGGLTMQGPWTDLYALAGVVHYAITGRRPVPSAERVVNDTQPLLAVSHAGRYHASLLRAVDAGLAVLPAARPQDVEAFRELLNGGLATDSPLRLATPKLASLSALPEAPVATEPFDEEPPIGPLTKARPTAPAPSLVPSLAPSLAPASTHAAPSRHSGWWLFGSVVLCVAAGIVYWWPKATVMPPPPTATPVSAAPAAKPLAPTPTAEPRMAPAPDKPPPAVNNATKARIADPHPKPLSDTALVTRKPVRPTPVLVSESVKMPPAPVESSSKQESKPSRCSELVLKASLDSLTVDELSFLKSKCR